LEVNEKAALRRYMKNLKHIGLKGSGYFCNVKLYHDEKTGEEFALKELKKEYYQKEEYRYRLKREIQLLKELQGCDNIIELLEDGNDKEKRELWYLMPFAKQNLYDYIKTHNNTLDKRDRYDVTHQIIQAIKYAHSRNILHRDISPNNVLVFYIADKIKVKVSDFGLGKDAESLSYYTGSSVSGYGQILYVSPEQRDKLKDATNKSDIYSLGKLVYFIFTAKDPDNLKPFELSTLVAKSIEDNPEDRFKDIIEFEKHFQALRDLQLDQKIPTEYITLREITNSGETIDWLQFHQLAVKGDYIEHVYHDYLHPIIISLSDPIKIREYYDVVGNGIRDFINTFSDRLNDCYKTVRWPFSSMSTFGIILRNVILIVSDDETRLICFKQLWYLAYEADQWDVQKYIKEVLNARYMTTAIETQFAEYIIERETKIDIGTFSPSLPQVIKLGIIRGNKNAIKKEEEREKRWKEQYGKTDW